MLKKKRLPIFILLPAVLLVVVPLAFSCASPKPQPKVAEPPPKKPATATLTISDDRVIQLLVPLIGDSGVHFLPGNKAYIRYGGDELTFSIEAVGGELCVTGMERVLYRYGTERYSKYLKKREDGKVYLVALWFDPRKELKAQSDQLPYIESVTTTEGAATFTYRKP